MPDQQDEPDQQDDSGAAAVKRRFRAEALVSDGDLRIEAAKQVVRSVVGDEEVLLRERSLHARGDFSYLRGSRTVEVFGDYERHTEDGELYPISGAPIRETVRGGVEVTAGLETEAIMGGGYVGTMVGPFLRMAAWVDFLCWGGWGEVDLARVEIAGVMIRAMTVYNHACGARILLAAGLVDDFGVRNEAFGVFTDNQAAVIHAGGPGAGVENTA